MQNLIRSRKFWIMILDLTVSILLHFGAKYLAPDVYEDTHFLIVTLQPVFLALIGGIAYEDGQAKRAGFFFAPPEGDYVTPAEAAREVA